MSAMVKIGGTWFRADSVDAVTFVETERVVRGVPIPARNVQVFLRGQVVTVRAREEDTEERLIKLLALDDEQLAAEREVRSSLRVWNGTTYAPYESPTDSDRS